MSANGGTNLSGGLLQGLEEIGSRKETKEATVSTVFLFTDGQASSGIRDAAGILKLVEGVTKKMSGVVSVSTFGFGSDHDAGLLRGISDGTNGMFYYVASAEDIGMAFADSLGGLLSVVAQNLDLTLTAGEGVTISELAVTYKYRTVEPGRKFTLRLADIYSEEKRDLVLRLHLPVLQAPATKTTILSATLCFINTPTTEKEEATASATIDRPEAATLGGPNASIAVQRNRICATKAINAALEDGKKGDFTSAQKALTDAAANIKATDAVSQQLLADLNDAKGKLANKSTYAGGGAQQMYSVASAHGQQRSNMSSPMYSNSVKQAQQMQVQQVLQAPMPRSAPQSAPQMQYPPQQRMQYQPQQQQMQYPPQQMQYPSQQADQMLYQGPPLAPIQKQPTPPSGG